MVALERYLNILKPFRYTSKVPILPLLCYSHKSCLQIIFFAGEAYILPTLALSFLYNINKFMEFTTIYEQIQIDNTTRYFDAKET